jgi:hypothetical protein
MRYASANDQAQYNIARTPVSGPRSSFDFATDSTPAPIPAPTPAPMAAPANTEAHRRQEANFLNVLSTQLSFPRDPAGESSLVGVDYQEF